MTATDNEAAINPHPSLISLAATNLNIFAIELGVWALTTSVNGSQVIARAGISTLQLIEKSKKKAIAPMLPRNSSLGRPFSPLGVGGLSAILGISSAFFSHGGGMVGASTPEALAQISTTSKTIAIAGNVLSSDTMIGSSKLHTVIPEGRTREEVIVHKVEGGETLESIAKDYKVTVDSIKYVNNMEDTDTIQPGQELTILPVTGVLHEVTEGDTLESIAEKWKVPAQAIVNINWLDAPYQVHAGQKLVIPNAEIPKPVEPEPATPPNSGFVASAETQQAPASTGSFLFPTSGEITQYFSYYHNGIDIGTLNEYRPIWASDSGVVTFAGWWNGGGGYSVWIDHGNGYVTQYAHMSRIGVSVGQSVYRGEQIGNTGATGLAFGNHLHFNVLLNGRLINPLSVL